MFCEVSPGCLSPPVLDHLTRTEKNRPNNEPKTESMDTSQPTSPSKSILLVGSSNMAALRETLSKLLPEQTQALGFLCQ